MKFTSRNRVIVHLFYETEKGAILKHIKRFILVNVEYEDIPTTIRKIVLEYYNTYSDHEIKSIAGVQEQIWVNSKLI